MESESICDFLSLSATASGESRDQSSITMSSYPALPAAAEVSPGEGAFSPPSDNGSSSNSQQDAHDDGDAMGFGPPPAFPNSNGKLHAGKRKQTLMAVSTSTSTSAAASNSGNTTRLEDVSSDEEDDVNEGVSGSSTGNNKNKQSQMIHRIKNTTAAEGPNNSLEKTKQEEEDDGAKSYIDAMLLASLSDVDSPKRRVEEFANVGASTQNKSSPSENVPQESSEVVGGERSSGNGQTMMMTDSVGSPKATIYIGTSSTAPTPLRSNVKVNLVKPYALMPKPNKRGKFASSTSGGGGTSSSSSMSGPPPPPPPSNWPDVRDPKADKLNKNDRGAIREGIVYGAPSQYPMGYPTAGGYPYPSYPPAPSAVPPTHLSDPSAVGYAAYPPPLPSRGPPSVPYAHFPQGPHPGSSPYHPSTRPYYPPGTGHPAAAGSPDRWEHYPPTTSSLPDSNKQSSSGWTPETVHSTNNDSSLRQPQPSSSSSSSSRRNKTHVVPSEDGEQAIVGGAGAAVVEGAYRGPPYPGAYPPPPPPGYPYAMYGPPGYHSGPPFPPPHEYNAISGDDGSPPRTTLPSSHHHGGPGGGGHPGDYYSPAIATPPRSGVGGSGGGRYEYYPDQSPQPVVPPGSFHGAYPPPPPPPHTLREGYHPDSPMTSMYPHPPPPYGAAPPSSSSSQFAYHESYDPYNYPTNSPSSSDHHDVTAAVSSETEVGGGGVLAINKYHQFRKGGRSVHSAPIILRKKFSWRNYAELEEYLIANRAEYLRHSALNYTAEQKHFNNQLTEGLLELAAKLNYVFDETCFNFVTVRDRIRCYYKSYVQSSKKRGVVVGFSNNMHHHGDGCSE
jgi:hypothetical protein